MYRNLMLRAKAGNLRGLVVADGLVVSRCKHYTNTHGVFDWYCGLY